MAKKTSSRKTAAKRGKSARSGKSARAGGAAGKAAQKSAKKPAPRKRAKEPAARPPRTSGKVKSSLRKAELREFRQVLLEKRRAILGDMSGIESEALWKNRKEGSGDLSNMPTHPADIGTDNYEHEFTLGLLESERTLLAEIDAALARIEDGTFGICLGTGEPIGKPRLKARPWAKYCIEYARQVERGLVRPDEDRLD